MKHIVSLILLPALFFAPSADAFGQRVKTWIQAEQTETFKHGRFALPVSNTIELVSLHYDTFQYDMQAKEAIRMRFYAPKVDDFFLHLDERLISAYYRLESNPGKVREGYNDFGPLPIGPTLRYLHVPLDNLAVLLHLGADDSNYYLPLSVYCGEKPAIRSIRAVFRFGKAVSKGSYQVFKGIYKGVLPKEDAAYSGAIGRKLAGSLQEIDLDTHALAAYSGWFTVSLSMQERGTTRIFQERFFFFHHTE